jgi:putative colanic acid biosynthesis UDP-glucose lipid carrier transferase
MSYSFFTYLPSSTSLTGRPTRSQHVGGAASATVGWGRLAVLLVLAAATFLLMAVAAYFAALLYHRLLRPCFALKRRWCSHRNAHFPGN